MLKKEYKIQDIYPSFQTNESGLDNVTQTLSKLKLYCGNMKPKKDCCFSHLVGLPKHPATMQEMKFMPHQIDLMKQSMSDKQLKFHINKSRQIGLTEIVLRIIQYQSFHKYAGGKILIIAGTREKTTKTVMNRLKALFNEIRPTVKDDRNVLDISLMNGTQIEGKPSNSEAIRGETKIKAVVIDEAAHFAIIDDSVVLDAIEPILHTNKSDIFLVSTPRGQRGFFYDLSLSTSDYRKIQYDYTHAVGWIYSEKEMEEELKRRDIDVDQEYRCQFTSSRSSIFGVISDDSTEEYEAEMY